MSVNVFAAFDEQVGAQPEPEPPAMIWDTPIDLPALLHKKPNPREWLIKDRLIAGRGAVVSGIGGSGKTTFQIQIAVGVAIGRLPWEDWEVEKTGKSILVLTEDTEDEFHYKIHYICEMLNLSLEEKKTVYESIIAYPVAGKNSILLQKNRNGTVEVSDLYRGLVAKIQEVRGVVFVGLDPALSLSGGDELDQSHQRRLGKMADDLGVLTGATVMLVAHAAKTLKNEIGSHNARGGGALIDAIRTEMVVRTMTPDEANKARIELNDRHKFAQVVCTKGNFLPHSSFRPTWLERLDHGVLVSADIEIKDSNGQPDQTAMKILGVLKDLSKNGTAVKKRDWLQQVIERKIIKGKKQHAQTKEMDRTIKSLFKAGYIRKCETKGYYEPEPEEEGYDYDLND